MLKHSNQGVCPLCEEKLKTAHITLAEWFRNRVRPIFHDAHISCAFRNKEDQEKAYIEGATAAHWPNSCHNVCGIDGDPCAEALDLFQIDKTGKAKWEEKFYSEIGKFCKTPQIEWPITYKRKFKGKM